MPVEASAGLVVFLSYRIAVAFILTIMTQACLTTRSFFALDVKYEPPFLFHIAVDVVMGEGNLEEGYS